VAFTLLFDSNETKYGGSGAARNRDSIVAEEVPWHGHAFSISVSLPALSAVILQPEPPVG
jgi:1,4-alpha-glucan branching enzyme